MKEFPTKDELYAYYITENNTFVATRTHFNITHDRLHKLLKEYDIKKMTTKDFLNAVSRDEIFDLYIIKDISFSDCVNHFNITPDIFSAALKTLGINKSKEISNKKDKFREKALSIDADTIYKYYIEENHTQEETAQFFGIRTTDLTYLINHKRIFKINKPKHTVKSAEEAAESISPEMLRYKYIEQNYTIRQCADAFDTSVTRINYLIKEYKLKKDPQDIAINARKSKLKNSGYLGNGKLFESYAPEYRDMYYDKDRSKTYLDVQPYFTARELAERFNCKPINIFHWAKRHDLRHMIRNEKSHYEQEIVDYILSLDSSIQIQRNKRYSFMNNQELDIYLPDYQLAIEFNGTYWHSNQVIEDKKYHLNKSLQAEASGIHLIHIYEYEWVNDSKRSILETLIKLNLNMIDRKLYARNCIIREISNSEAKEFNDKNHLQGHRPAQVTLGLFFHGELVQLMSFSRSKYNRNLKGANSWEIIRGCPGSDSLVIGGVSKLMKHFIRTYRPESLFSYCDFNKFNGQSYTLSGMKFIGLTGPDKKYVIGNQVVNRNPARYQELKDKIEMTIYGAGSKKYLLDLSFEKS